METSRNVGTIHESQTLLRREDERIYETIDGDGDTYVQMASLPAVKPAAKMEETYLDVIM